jgi:phage terminase large subunit-like protein
MLDRFAVEINRIHDIRARLKALNDDERRVLAKSLTDDVAGDWIFTARDAQLPPRDLDWCWLFLGGRGTGKTHSVSSAVHMAIRAGIKRLHVIAPTTADVHDVNLEGSSGILATAPDDMRPRWLATKRRLEWPNGAKAVMFSGEEPDSLRGPQCEMAIIDEIGRMRYQQEVFDMMMMGLRLGDKPRVLIATTPRPSPFMKKLTAMADIRITSGTTYENAQHLSASFLKKIRELYEGTRLGRQELLGGMLLDPAGALFKDEWLQHEDIPDGEIEQVAIGVDPSGGSDDVGIVVSALLNNGRFAVLADRTLTASPAQWGDEVVRAYDEFDADDVVVERNFGGDMAVEVVKAAAERAFDRGERALPMIRIDDVVASRGKVLRAEPISLLYEKGRVLHRRGLDQLEGEMLSFSREWDRSVDGSPNRLDAMVWGLSRLSRVVTHIPMA